MINNPTDFAALSDNEINRWAAERDGWEPIGQPLDTSWMDRHDRYVTSADAALALLERWGMQWCRSVEWTDGTFYAVTVWWREIIDAAESIETPTRKFPRALLNAACAAKEAQDAG